ncbi:MAG: zinc-ribbon domain-containing protein [Endomicrobiia bacterium]
MFCSNCGKENPGIINFCIKCGKPLKSTTENNQPEETSPQLTLTLKFVQRKNKSKIKEENLQRF